MFTQAGSASRTGYGYARFLLQDRRRELQTLELRHQRKEMLPEDYLNCQRALLQAISELASLIRLDSDASLNDNSI